MNPEDAYAELGALPPKPPASLQEAGPNAGTGVSRAQVGGHGSAPHAAPAPVLDPAANRLALACLVALVLGVLVGAVVAVWP